MALIEPKMDLERRYEIAEGLRKILAVLNSNRSLDEILSFIIGEAMRLLDAQAAAIYRLQPEMGVLTILSSLGLSAEYRQDAVIPLGQVATGRAVLNHQPVMISDLAAETADQSLWIDDQRLGLLRRLVKDYRALLAVPLVTQDQTLGALTLYYSAVKSFSREEVDLAVAFCDQAALAIENARLRAKSQEDAIAAERSRIARDLHDSVTQLLFSASLISEVLPTVWERSPEEGRQGLTELRLLTRGALAEMRSMLLELRPASLVEAKLPDLLNQLGEAVAARMHIPVEVVIQGTIDLPTDTRVAFYRIAQEALNNMAKHARADRAWITLQGTRAETAKFESQAAGQRDPDVQVMLSIRDNGCGFDPQHATADHLGLGIMRERANSVGAGLSIRSQTGCGTEIIVYWPELDQKG
jgi:signal transduction histidine kinase